MDEIKREDTLLAEILEETLPEELNQYLENFRDAFEKINNKEKELEEKINKLNSEKEELLKAQNELEQVKASYSSKLIEINKKHNDGIESIKEAIKKCNDNSILEKAIEVEEQEKTKSFLEEENNANREINNIIGFLNVSNEMDAEEPVKSEINPVNSFDIDNLPDFNINQIGSEDLLDKEEEKHDDFITIESKTKVPEESVKEILSSNEVMNNVKKFLNGGTING